MSIQNEQQYREIVKSIASKIVTITIKKGLDNFTHDEGTIDTQTMLDFMNDNDIIHDVVNSSEYIHCTDYDLDILKYSDNDDAILRELGSDFLNSCDSFVDIAGRFAHWALYTDVRNELYENIETYAVTIISQSQKD